MTSELIWTGRSTMLREIHEGPEATARTLERLLPLQDQIAGMARGRRHVLFSARGSSDNAAMYGRYLLETRAGLPAAMLAPSVFTHYDARPDLSDTLVVSVSQSGATSELVDVQERVRACGAATIAVTNVADSPLAAAADLALVTQAGPEVAVPATKTYLTQTVAMAVLGTALSARAPSLDADLRRVPDLVRDALGRTAEIDEAACTLAGATGATVVTGRGMMLGTALETALKIEETCLRAVRGYSYADLRHGPIAVVRPGTVAVLVAAADGPMVSAIHELATDLAERGAAVVAIGGDEQLARTVHVHVPAPPLPEALAPVGTIVPAQLMVERLAARLDLDPDSPRGLAKITQTDAHGAQSANDAPVPAQGTAPTRRIVESE
ncbi:SIS domain-containing protein [Arsenicicoccus dermatophilus]|uniref:SIS domain-containing protein n=1 Tax=Arsenicicoccus dermatophilus TaxID=1076331 RepID=UPI00391760DF